MTRLRIVLAASAVAVCGCSSVPAASVPRSGVSTSRPFAAGNWVIVSPGEDGPANNFARLGLDVLPSSARKVSKVPGPPGRGETFYPWAVSGQYVAAVTGIFAGHASVHPVAYAFRPGGAYVRLGPAIAVFAASQQGRFWIRGALGGNTPGAWPRDCTVTEMSATGVRIGGPLAAPCTRWIIAAVPGGFVSEPTTFPNAARITGSGQISPGSPVQLWSPVSGKVVRTYGIKPGWIDGAAGQYLAWQPQSATGPHMSSVQITNLSSGTTKRIALPLSARDVTWRNPVLAPQGRYVAWMEITRATWRKFSLESPSGAGGAPGPPGSGRIKILDLATGRVSLDRALTIAWSAALRWSPDAHYLFAASSYTSVSVVPTWSATAPVRTVQLPSGGDVPDSQQFLVTEGPPSS